MDDFREVSRPEPTRSVRADMADRAERAWVARVLGASWKDAAMVSGYSDGSNCRRAVMSVYGQLPKIDREHLRTLWRERGELLWRQVVKDVHNGVPGAVTAAVRVMQAAARLDGLDEPSRVELSSPSDREIQEWVDMAWIASRPQLEEGDIFAETKDS